MAVGCVASASGECQERRRSCVTLIAVQKGVTVLIRDVSLRSHDQAASSTY